MAKRRLLPSVPQSLLPSGAGLLSSAAKAPVRAAWAHPAGQPQSATAKSRSPGASPRGDLAPSRLGLPQGAPPRPASFPFDLGRRPGRGRMVISQRTAIILFPYSAHLDAMCLISRHRWTLFFLCFLETGPSFLGSSPTMYTHTPSSEEPRMMPRCWHCQTATPKSWGARRPKLSSPTGRALTRS